MAVPIFENKQ